jgi:alpha-amylase
MKNYLIVAAALLVSTSLFAKKVKLAVNMANEIVNTTGIHVYGDFQTAAGYPFDWDPGATTMTQEAGDPDVYSVVVDIPAFHVYQYRFINGDQSYEIEFVPEESRVNGAFNDNRWMYVDSAADDTAFTGIFPYSANAPVGLTLVVFKVNMSLQTVSPEGVHVAGSFQGWDPAASTMISFNDTVYLYQAYIQNGTWQFKFVNGNAASGYEYVSGACAVGGNREVEVTTDIALEPFNFSSCIVGVDEALFANAVDLFPNPSAGTVVVEFNDNNFTHNVIVSDVAGRSVKRYRTQGGSLRIENLDAGIYSVNVSNAADKEANLRLIVQ